MTPAAYIQIRVAAERLRIASDAYRDLMASHGFDSRLSYVFDDSALTVKEVLPNGDVSRDSKR